MHHWRKWRRRPHRYPQKEHIVESFQEKEQEEDKEIY